jgi:hypothetical protein
MTMDVRKPNELCNPANLNDQDPDALLDTDHLLSYTAGRTRNTATFTRLRNQKVVTQFGTIYVDVLSPISLVVPSATSLTSMPDPLASPGVDHFQCHRISKTFGTQIAPLPDVTVEDEFITGLSIGLRRRLLTPQKRPARLCAPVDVNGQMPDAPSHTGYLLCYVVKLGTGSTFDRINSIFTADPLGTMTMDAIKPNQLCVPALVNP